MEDSEVRKGFISAVLKIHPTEVVETILIPTHLRKKHKKDKLGVLDVCVRLNRKQQIDMEIQIASFPSWEERTLFYLSKMYTGNLSEGEELPKLAEKEFPESGLLNWAKFLSAERKEDLMQMAAKNEYIGKAYDRLAHISADEEKRLIRLMQKMSEGPDAALIPNLCRDSGLLQQMYEKYKI